MTGAGWLAFAMALGEGGQDGKIQATGPEFDAARGVHVFKIRSPYLGGENAVEVLLPKAFDKDRRVRVLYVLPVEAGIGGRFGDGLAEVRRSGAHDRHGFIAVTPAFDTLPWYGAHATDPAIRHEDHLKKVVVPLIESRYPTTGLPMDRLLFGFSKSGWGALTLLLRDPDFFGYACSWDAPLMMDRSGFGLFGTRGHFGTADQYAQYLPSEWAAKNAGAFQKKARIAVLGLASFGRNGHPGNACHTETFHKRLEELGVRHRYDAGLKFAHEWGSGWVPKAIETLMEMAKEGEGER
jgi:hypothetical protein